MAPCVHDVKEIQILKNQFMLGSKTKQAPKPERSEWSRTSTNVRVQDFKKNEMTLMWHYIPIKYLRAPLKRNTLPTFEKLSVKGPITRNETWDESEVNNVS